MMMSSKLKPVDRPLPDPQLDDQLPQSVAKELRVVPLRFLGDTLVLASPDELGQSEKERLAFILNRRVLCVIRPIEWHRRAMASLYPPDAESIPERHSICYYWGGWHQWREDTLVVKASGWNDMEHWNGAAEFPPHHPDYDLWRWIVKDPHYHRLIDEIEIPAIRRVWRRWRSRTL